MTLHEAFPDGRGPARPAGQVADELRQDEQPPICPALPLNEERAEVGGSRAEREALRIVVQLPPPADQVDGRFGVLDDRVILDVSPNRMAALGIGLGNVVERRFPDERVGAHPERRPVRSEALVNEVLDVGRRSCDPFEGARGMRESAVRRLDDGDPLVSGLGQHTGQAERVVGGDETVGVHHEDVIRIRYGEARLRCLRRLEKD